MSARAEGGPLTGSARRIGLGIWGPPIAVALAVVGLWYLLSYVLLAEDVRFLLPPPHEVVRVGFLDWSNLSEALAGLWSTALVALTGLVISIVLGVLVAIAMSQGRWIERSFYPYAVITQTIPILALVPLMGFWFGFGFGSRVIVCVIISLFPIIINTLFGLKSIDLGMHDLFTLRRASRWTRLRKLEFPGALPAFFTGLRTAAGLAVIGAIVGDFFFRQGEPGIGRLIDIYRSRLLSEQLFTAVILSSLLGIVAFWGFGLLAYLCLRSWHESERRGATS